MGDGKPTLFGMEKLMKLVSNKSWYSKHNAYALISLLSNVSCWKLGLPYIRNEINVYALGT